MKTRELRDQPVALLAEEGSRLKRLDRKVGLASELPEEWLETLRKAAASEEIAPSRAEIVAHDAS